MDRHILAEKAKKAVGVQGSFKEAILPMINYSFANIFNGGSGYIISLYFLAYITEAEGLDPKQAGIVVMLATLWDAVTDPAMGIITDRTHSKYGKHRRYIAWGIPIMAVSYIMLWYSFGISSLGKANLTMLYYTLAYMLFKTAYTIISVPHTAMLPEMAPEYSLRTQYNSVGYLFNSAGMVPSFLFVSCIFGFTSMEKFSPASRPRFLLVGIVLAAFYAVSLFITFKNVREPSSSGMEFPPFDKSYAFREYVQVFRNRAFRQYFAISAFFTMCTGFYMNSRYYLINYVANKYKLYNLLTGVAGVAEASAFPLNYALTMKYGKKKCGTIVTPLMIVGLAIGIFLPRSDGGVTSVICTLLLFLSMLLYPFGYSGIGFVTTNIFPDITDVDEMITGRRREGVISTFSTFIKKSVSGVMAAFVGFILKGFGLVTGDELTAYEASTGLLYEQSPRSLLGVRICAAVIPMVLVLVSLFFLRRFTMTKQDHEMIRAAIATKKAYGKVSLTPEQIKICETISGQKYENTWLGSDNGGEVVIDGVLREPTVERDSDGCFAILNKPAEAAEASVTEAAEAKE